MKKVVREQSSEENFWTKRQEVTLFTKQCSGRQIKAGFNERVVQHSRRQ